MGSALISASKIWTSRTMNDDLLNKKWHSHFSTRLSETNCIEQNGSFIVHYPLRHIIAIRAIKVNETVIISIFIGQPVVLGWSLPSIPLARFNSFVIVFRLERIFNRRSFASLANLFLSSRAAQLFGVLVRHCRSA